VAKKTFDWVRDAEEPMRALVERESRSKQEARARKAADLVDQLVGLGESAQKHVPLDDSTHRELREYARISPKARSARRRQLNHLGTLLLAEDLDAIEAALGGGSGPTEREAQIELLVRWRKRFIDERDAAIDAFIEQYPDADRQQLRQLTSRAAKLVGSPAGTKASRALLKALRAAADLL